MLQERLEHVGNALLANQDKLARLESDMSLPEGESLSVREHTPLEWHDTHL